jgi:Flp pilus assembly protein protease CpaA
LHVSIGAIAGLLLGLGSWLAAGYFIRRYQAVGDADDGWLQSTRLRSLPALFTIAATAVVAGYFFREGPDLAHVVALLTVTALLLIITLVDMAIRRIPNVLVLLLLGWAVVQTIWIGRPDFKHMAYGVALAGGIFFLIAVAGRGAMGAGDVKLVASLGGLLGYPVFLAGLFGGVVAGGLGAVLLLITRRAGRRDFMPYGPFLVLGAYVIWTRYLGFWP